MEESSIYRALTIAVALFIAIATITAVLSYYNTAKAMVQAIGTGTDFGEIYSDYVEDILLKADANTNVTGTEVINLINYFYKNEKTQINIKKMMTLYDSTNLNADLLASNVNIVNVNNDESLYNKYFSQIVPSQKFKITRTYNSGILTIELEGIG